MTDKDQVWQSATCYHRLDAGLAQFRTLTLLPGNWAEPIQCRLNVHTLNNHPKYRTLSYAWGDSSDTAEIIVNGVKLGIPSTLERCLKHLRSPESALEDLWADAICINQSNMEEKSHQVSNMGAVYWRCSSMIIWFGETHPTYPLQDPFEMVIHWAEDKHFHQYPGFSISETGGWIFHNNLAYQQMYELFADFVSRPWWSRLWIVQEIALSPAATVVLGTWQIPWATLLTALKNHYRHVSTCCADASRMHPAKYTYDSDHLLFLSQQSDRAADMETVLRAFRHKLCKNPRDKIYGLLGLLWKNRNVKIRPDYSLPVNRVYLEATQAIISQSEGDLQFLTGLGFNSESYQLPSWVRNFDIPLTAAEANHEHSRYRRYRNYFASAEAKYDIEVLNDDTLALTGTFVDRIERIGMRIQDRNWPQIWNALQDWAKIANLTTTDQDHEETIRERYWRTLMADIVPTNTASNIWNRVTNPMEFSTSAGLTAIVDNLREGREPPLTPVVQAFWAATYSRAFFRTELGHFGLCFPHSRIGDEVWVLAGGKVPFVLRSIVDANEVVEDDTSGPRYRRLVGECYLHGYMDGEGLRQQDGVLVPVHLK